MISSPPLNTSSQQTQEGVYQSLTLPSGGNDVLGFRYIEYRNEVCKKLESGLPAVVSLSLHARMHAHTHTNPLTHRFWWDFGPGQIRPGYLSLFCKYSYWQTKTSLEFQWNFRLSAKVLTEERKVPGSNLTGDPIPSHLCLHPYTHTHEYWGVRVREREWESVCMNLEVCARVCVCLCVWKRVCVCVYVCVRERKRELCVYDVIDVY